MRWKAKSVNKYVIVIQKNSLTDPWAKKTPQASPWTTWLQSPTQTLFISFKADSCVQPAPAWQLNFTLSRRTASIDQGQAWHTQPGNSSRFGDALRVTWWLHPPCFNKLWMRGGWCEGVHEHRPQPSLFGPSCFACPNSKAAIAGNDLQKVKGKSKSGTQVMPKKRIFGRTESDTGRDTSIKLPWAFEHDRMRIAVAW